jgi:uric acid-xanthine permease
MSSSLPVVKDQPTSTPSPIVRPEGVLNEKEGTSFLRREATRIARKFTTRQGWLGDYDYAWYVSVSNFKLLVTF